MFLVYNKAYLLILPFILYIISYLLESFTDFKKNNRLGRNETYGHIKYFLAFHRWKNNINFIVVLIRSIQFFFIYLSTLLLLNNINQIIHMKKINVELVGYSLMFLNLSYFVSYFAVESRSFRRYDLVRPNQTILLGILSYLLYQIVLSYIQNSENQVLKFVIFSWSFLMVIYGLHLLKYDTDESSLDKGGILFLDRVQLINTLLLLPNIYFILFPTNKYQNGFIFYLLVSGLIYFCFMHSFLLKTYNSLIKIQDDKLNLSILSKIITLLFIGVVLRQLT